MKTERAAPCSDNIDNADKLLKLIDEGDANSILSEENMQKSFSKLLKYELIIVKDDKILLTDLGVMARLIGVQKVINEQKEKKIIVDAAAPVAFPKKVRSSNALYYILLLLGLLAILFIQISWD